MAPKRWGIIMEALEFQVSEVIQRGERTTLLRAYDPATNHHVVLKVMTPSEEPTISDFHRFEYEFEIGSQLSLDSIVRPIKIGRFDGKPALVMEDFGGTALRTLITRPLETEVFLDVALKVTAALREVHRNNILHRDIKPDNILVNSLTRQVKLADFGIARRFIPGYRVTGATEPVEGSWAYVSPEQTGRVNRAVDFRSDLYSLGVSFFEMLTGRLPFDAVDTPGWIHCHIARLALAPRDILPTIPKMLSDIVCKLLAKDPSLRYQSAAGLYADLEHCRNEYQALGRIEPFRLADKDWSSSFQIPQKLYGRDKEREFLLTLFSSVVSSEKTEGVMVGGYSGIGKSSLVRELSKPVVEQRGFFISGKFEQYNRSTPYAALAQAIKELIHQLLSQSEASLEQWRLKVRHAVGRNGKVLTDVMPAVELLIGKQPPVALLGSAESQNRFNLVFQDFLRVFAGREHPLVLFLDDLQWADGASLNLLPVLLSPSTPGPFLLLLAYRSNEVDETHPFLLTVEQIEAHLRLQRLQLEALDKATVKEFIFDTLQARPERAEELAELIATNTGGNPFFVIEFLKTLHQEKLLSYDAKTRSWRGETERIRSKGVTTNVVELLIRKLESLPPLTRELLAKAACLGGQFDADLLAQACDMSSLEVMNALEKALENGLLHVAGGGETLEKQTYKFNHDRIQQAAYALVEESERAGMRLHLARRLLARSSAEQIETRLFDIVALFSSTLECLTDPREREQVLELQIRAGQRAKASSAYLPAQTYFSQAASLLDEAAWDADYSRVFDLYFELAECEYLSGHLAQSDKLSRLLLTKAKSNVARAKIYHSQIKLYQVSGEFDRAVAIIAQALHDLGIEMPAREEAGTQLEVERNRAEQRLRTLAIDDLLKQAQARDPVAVAALSILEASGPPIYMVRPELFAWVAVKAVNLSLDYGNTPASCYGYGIYGIILCAAFGEVARGLAFAQLAIALNEKFQDAQLKGCMLHFLGDHVNFWKNHVASDLPILARGFNACVEGGDLIYSNYIGFQSPWHLWETGAPLDEVHRFCEKYAAFAQRTKYDAVFQTIRLEQQLIANLKGQTHHLLSFSSDELDEEEAIRIIMEAKFGCGIAYYHVMKLVSSYYLGAFGAALESAKKAQESIGAAFSMPIQTSFVFFQALTACACLGQAEASDQPALLKTAQDACSQLQAWAESAPENFKAKHALLAAEIAALQGDFGQACQSYDKAIRRARRVGFRHIEALANELAANFYLKNGAFAVGGSFLREAIHLYTVWGAAAKVRQLNQQHCQLLKRLPKAPGSAPTVTSVSDQLDLISVLKASQVISGQLELSELLETLMGIVVEYAGAEKGYLFFADNAFLRLKASAHVDGQAEALTARANLSDIAPLSLLNYVKRSHEPVILENASIPNAYSADPYFLKTKPKSVLSVALCRQSRLIGIIYLENNLVEGAFSRERLQVLDLLMGQIAVSIDNARLFQASQDSLRARDEFLSISSHELKTPLTALKLQLQMMALELQDGFEISAEELKEALATSLKQVQSLTHLVEDMLDISRIQLGKFNFSYQPMDLGELVRGVVESCQAQLEAAGITPVLQIESGVVGSWDQERLRQMVSNLLSNCIKYASGAPVEIRVEGLKESGVRLSVQDRGPGITSEQQEVIFERFRRATSKNISGLGLGLFVVKTIVEAHNGSVWVESEIGQGTKFIVNLPGQPSRAQAERVEH